MELTISQSEDCRIITLVGHIDWEDAHVLDTSISELVNDGVKDIVIDLKSVDFICSGGIGAIVYNLGRIRENKGALYIIVGNDYINYIFETLKFDVVFGSNLFNSHTEFLKAHQKKDAS
jgi:anti-anti-sigma factor